MGEMIETYKGIADYLSKSTGFKISDRSVQKYVQRQHDPLPLSAFLGRIGAKQKDLDSWIGRQWNTRRIRVSRAA